MAGFALNALQVRSPFLFRFRIVPSGPAVPRRVARDTFRLGARVPLAKGLESSKVFARLEARHDIRVASPAHLDPEIPVNDPAGRRITRQVLAQLESFSHEALFLSILLDFLDHVGVIRNIPIEMDEPALDDQRLFIPVRGDHGEPDIPSPVPGEEHRFPHALRGAAERIGAILTHRIAHGHVAPDDEINAGERGEQIEKRSPLHVREEYHEVAFLPQLIEHRAPFAGGVAQLEFRELPRFFAEEREDSHLRAAYLPGYEGREEAIIALIEICADERKPRLRIRFQGGQPEPELPFTDRHGVVFHLDHGLRQETAPIHFEGAGLPAEVACAEQEQLRIEASFLCNRGGPPGHAT